MDDSI
jgi:hypothetical protein